MASKIREPEDHNEDAPDQRYELVEVDLIKVDHGQPRKRINEEGIKALATSIRREGLLQPIVIKPSDTHDHDGTYAIVAGERRWRAFKSLKRKKIPAMIRGAGKTFALSLLENVLREDLNPIEEARAIKQLIREHGLTVDLIAEQVGKSRTWVQQRLLLLALPAEVQALVEEEKLPTVQALNLAQYRSPRGMVARIAHDLVAARLTGERAIRAIRAVLGGEAEGITDADLMLGARETGTTGMEQEEREVAAERRQDTVKRVGRLADELRRVNTDLGRLANAIEGAGAIPKPEQHDYFRSLPERTSTKLLMLALQVMDDLGLLFEIAGGAGVAPLLVKQYEEKAGRSGSPGGAKVRGQQDLRPHQLAADESAVPEWLLAPWAMLLHPDGPTRSASELAVRTGFTREGLPAFLDGALETVSQVWGASNGEKVNPEVAAFCAQVKARFPDQTDLAVLLRGLPAGQDPVALALLQEE